jgi:hypothetical protein
MKKNIKVSLEFQYPSDAIAMSRALHGDDAVKTLMDLNTIISTWEKGDRVCPDDLIDKIKANILLTLNLCKEHNVD